MGDSRARHQDENGTKKARVATGVLAAVLSAVLATVGGMVLFGRAQLADVVMIYLFGIILVSLRWGLAPSLLSAVLCILCFDYFFIPPYATFVVADFRHVGTFAVMFFVAAVVSGLTKRVRDQAEAARVRERWTASLYALSRALSAAKTRDEIIRAATEQIRDVFAGRATVLLPDRDGLRELSGDAAWRGALDDTDRVVAATYIPLEGASGRLGVFGFLPDGDAPSPDARRQLEVFAGQLAAALDRAHLAAQAHEAQLRVRAEELRNSLLSSVSHDLRTPLAVIIGAGSALSNEKVQVADRADLAGTIVQEAERLDRLVRNLLDVTRVEAGALRLVKEWQPVEEVVGTALAAVEALLGSCPVEVELAANLSAPFDAVLIQQVLINLIENAVKAAGPTCPITLSARGDADAVEIAVSDRGPGVPPGDEARIFEKFYRAEKGRGGGVGLGLTICRGIVTAHGGRIWVARREGGGSSFHFTLPCGPRTEVPEVHEAPAKFGEGESG